MRCALLILVISWVYVGCAGGPATAPVSGPGRSPDGSGRPLEVLRVFHAGRSDGRAVLLASITRPLAPHGMLTRRGRQTADEGMCYRYEVDPGATFPGGTPIEPEWIVAAWDADRYRPHDPLFWLLRPVRSAASGKSKGLYAEDGRLVVCVEHATPDWDLRLTHPALRLQAVDPLTGRVEGPGPFRWGPGEELTRRDDVPDAPALDRIRFVDPGEADPSVLLGRGEIDFAVVYGTAASALRRDGADRVRVERLPGWDEAYALWFNPGARWVNDPTFRRWMAGAVDRAAIVRLLFAGQGEASYRWVGEGPARWEPYETRPFSQTSLPRLTLVLDAEDPRAASIASRIKAVLEREGVHIDLEPLAAGDLGPRLAEGRFQAALIVHRSVLEDAVLDLQATLAPLRAGMPSAWALLEQASRVAGNGPRLRRARDAEDLLLADARLVPLVRLHAWRATAHGLEGLEVGRFGTLDLRKARWDR